MVFLACRRRRLAALCFDVLNGSEAVEPAGSKDTTWNSSHEENALNG